MPTIDFDQVLTAANGEPLTLAIFGDPAPDAEPERATLKAIVMNALLTPQQGDAETPTMGYRLYTLAHKIKDGKEVAVESAQVELIKRRVERIFPPWIVGQAWDMLEQRKAPVELAPMDLPPQGGAPVQREFVKGMRNG